MIVDVFCIPKMLQAIYLAGICGFGTIRWNSDF